MEREGSPVVRILFLGLGALCLAAPAFADPFVIDASSSVKFEVKRPLADIATLDDPAFIARHLPGIAGITPVEQDLYLWDFRMKVPLAKPMQGRFLARRNAAGPGRVSFESADPHPRDYMRCEISAVPDGKGNTFIRISIHLKFTRASGWQFHWLAPVLGEKFLSARVTERLESMLEGFILSSTKEWEKHGEPSAQEL